VANPEGYKTPHLVNQVGKGAGKLLDGIFKKPGAEDAAGDEAKKPNLGDALKGLFKKKDEAK